MEISVHDAVTVLHGMILGAVMLLGFSGVFAGLYAITQSTSPWTPSARERRIFALFLVTMATLAWLAVIVGAYVIYPWYRAKVPAGTVDLSAFPRQYLISQPTLRGWHDIGMEWKEHLAWFAPMALTAAAAIFVQYGVQLRQSKGLRRAVFALCLLAFFATGVAGFFGAMLNKFAPVRGGGQIVLMTGETNVR